MNAKASNIIILLLSLLLTGSCITSFVFCYRYNGLMAKYMDIDRQYRASLERAEEEQRELNATVASCRQLVEESKDVLCRAGNSLEDLRAGLRIIEKNYREMETLLRSIPVDSSGGNNTSGD